MANIHITVLLITLICSSYSPVKSENSDKNEIYTYFLGTRRIISPKWSCSLDLNCHWWHEVTTSRKAIELPTDQNYVHYLKINSNEFQYIPENLFHELDMHIINFETRNLRTIEEQDFEGTQLEVLKISQSSIKTLPPNVFRKLANLTFLAIEYSPIEYVDREAFNGLAQLEDLHLRSTNIKELHLEVFLPLTSLQNIVLNNNQLTTLERHIFFGNSQLKNVQLLGKFSHIDEKIFAPLRDVDLFIQFYPKPIFENLPAINFTIGSTIKHLTIENYDLAMVHFENAKLIKLVLRNCQVNSDFVFLQHLTRLQIFDVLLTFNNNRPVEFNVTTFAELTELEEVWIGDSRITWMKCGIFANNLKLRTMAIYKIYYSPDEVEITPCIFGQCAPNLEHLTISENYGRYRMDDFRAVAPKLKQYSVA